MNSRERLRELAARRERLVARAADERAEIALAVERLRTPLAAADGALRVARFVRAHPLVPVVTVVGLAVLGRRRFLGFAGRGLALWRAARVVLGWTRSLG